MSLNSVPLTRVRPAKSAAPAVNAVVVSLPFFTPFATCYPAILITNKLNQLGCSARFIPAHMEFYSFSRSRGLADELFKTFTNCHFAADVALLPLWSPGSEETYAAERIELRRTEFLVSDEDAAFACRIFDEYLDRLADRILKYDVVCLTSTHFQFLPSLLLARRLRDRARERGTRRPHVVIGGYFGAYQVAKAVLEKHLELNIVVYGEAEDVLGEALDNALSGRRKVVYGRAHSFRDSYAGQSEMVKLTADRPWLRRRLVVSLELSRGCYWDRCDFCNFNDSYDARFKMHDPRMLLREMDHLATAFGQRQFQFLDTALPPRLVNELGGIKRDFKVFCEIRPDFGVERLAALATFGQVTVQLGIETLHEGHLALMNKRQSVADGVRMLYAARSHGMRSVWGVMVGHPKETAAHRDELLTEIRAHRRHGLPAPKYLTECELRPGSGLWEDRQRLGLTVEFPWRMFDSVLPPAEHSCALIPCRVRGMPDGTDDYRAFRKVISRELLEWQREQGLEPSLDA